MQLFPVEVNRASFDMLLRIPGVGLISAERMVKARRLSPLTWDGLKRMGIVLKRARHFILVSGKYYGSFSQDPVLIYSALSERKDEIQTDLFDKLDALEPAIRIKSHSTKPMAEPVPLPGIMAALPGGAS
jgi:predicted DNA-binding helix-hairpin-helix protein